MSSAITREGPLPFVCLTWPSAAACRPAQVMLTRPSHMAAGFDPDGIKGKAALVCGPPSKLCRANITPYMKSSTSNHRCLRAPGWARPRGLLPPLVGIPHTLRAYLMRSPPPPPPSPSPAPCPAGIRAAVPPAQGGGVVLCAGRPCGGEPPPLELLAPGCSNKSIVPATRAGARGLACGRAAPPDSTPALQGCSWEAAEPAWIPLHTLLCFPALPCPALAERLNGHHAAKPAAGGHRRCAEPASACRAAALAPGGPCLQLLPALRPALLAQHPEQGAQPRTLCPSPPAGRGHRRAIRGQLVGQAHHACGRKHGGRRRRRRRRQAGRRRGAAQPAAGRHQAGPICSQR